MIPLIYFLYNSKQPFTDYDNGTIIPCVCAFDIDGTITIGLTNGRKAVDECKRNNCKIAINTARPTKWYSDLDLVSLGLKESDFVNNFYYGEPFNYSFVSKDSFNESIANTKVKHLHTMSNRWKVNPKKIILFDDLETNIRFAKNAGFSTISAYEESGLPDDVNERIINILN